MGSKFAEAPQQQKPPPQCKKVPLPPPNPIPGCPVTWPDYTLWQYRWDFMFGIFAVRFAGTIRARNRAFWNFTGTNVQVIPIGPDDWTITTAVDYHGSAPGCNSSFDLLMIAQHPTLPSWNNAAFWAGTYLGGLPFYWPTRDLATFPFGGTVTVSGS